MQYVYCTDELTVLRFHYFVNVCVEQLSSLPTFC